jgi:hypothetical protein
MRNTLFSVILIGTFGLLTGCSPTWFKDFKDNPVQQTDSVLGSIASAESTAVIAFGQLKPLLSADKQVEYQAKFDESIVALNTSMDAVRAAVKAAAESQVEHPDFSVVIANAIKAVDTVRIVIVEVHDVLKSPKMALTSQGTVAEPPSLAQDKTAYIELGNMVDALKK